MQEHELAYKDFVIHSTVQEMSGDNYKVFFRVSKNSQSLFTLWVSVSGTSARDMAPKDVRMFLINEGGLEAIRIIDSGNIKIGGEYSRAL